jgi:hypothetical protein
MNYVPESGVELCHRSRRLIADFLLVRNNSGHGKTVLLWASPTLLEAKAIDRRTALFYPDVSG